MDVGLLAHFISALAVDVEGVEIESLVVDSLFLSLTLILLNPHEASVLLLFVLLDNFDSAIEFVSHSGNEDA